MVYNWGIRFGSEGAKEEMGEVVKIAESVGAVHTHTHTHM